MKVLICEFWDLANDKEISQNYYVDQETEYIYLNKAMLFPNDTNLL